MFEARESEEEVLEDKGDAIELFDGQDSLETFSVEGYPEELRGC